MQQAKWITGFAILVTGVATVAASDPGYDRVTGRAHASRSEVIAPHAMAATSQPLATQVALDILKAGGSAVDAAIAANATLGLMEPTGNGIGGDLFAIVWDAEKKELVGLNASGRAPKAMTLEYFQKNGIEEIPPFGPLPVSVPGAVDGWFQLHGRYGRLDMKEILAPAIAYAREGFPVSEVIAHYFQSNKARISHFPGFAETYMPNGDVPKKGEMFKNPRLANTLEAIADKGRDEFYKGDIAKRIDAYMAEQGGLLTYDDLAAHESEWVTPVSTNYRGWDVYELPPNGQGIAALQILNVLEGYDLAAMGFGSAEYIHTFVEAKKLAFEDRAKYYADMDFVDVPVEILISKDYADQRRKLIDANKASSSLPAGDAKLENGDTIYLTVNVVEGGKRPFHTIIPAFVMKDGEPLISFGLMGGAMQPQGHAQIVINMIDFGMNLQEAGDAARINHTGSSQPTGSVMTDGGVVHLETTFSLETREALEAMGHTLGSSDGSFGGYQAIMWDKEQGVYYGASEVRKDGQAAGY